MEKIAAFFMSLVMLLSGAAPGSAPERAENFRVVSYLIVNSVEAAKKVDASHFPKRTARSIPRFSAAC